MRHLMPIFLLFSLSSQLLAQEGSKRVLPAVKLEAPPKIDGDLGDEVWQKAVPLTGFWDVNQGKQVAEQTHCHIGYDSKFIYVAFDIRDTKPELITAAETQEDSRFSNQTNSMDSLSEDVVDVRLDPFSTGTTQGSSIFSVNAIGTKSARLGGGRAKKTEWKGEWKAFVKRTTTGWTAEMQIPWQIMNYPYKKNAQNLGINFFRYHHRLNLPSYWSNIGPNSREELQGIWTGVETPAPPQPKVSILPYVIGGIDDKNRAISRMGVDARFPLSAEITAVGSLNPDFGTIEGAVESVGFSRTERFVPERRPFFLEGQGFFQAGMGFDIGQMFYARRIGRFDLGTKVYGKIGKKDSLGILSTMTFGDRIDAVANWSHQQSPFESYGVFANVKSSDADKASVLSANYTKEWGKLALYSRYARSDDNGQSALASSNSVWYQDKANFLFLGYNDTNDKFRLPDGLLGFNGIKGWELYDELSFDWRNGPVRQSSTEFSASWNNALDGSPFQRGASISTFAGLRNGWGASLKGFYYDYGGLFDRDVQLNVVKGWDNRFNKIGFAVGGGTIANGGTGYYALQFARRIAKGFDIGYSGYFQNLDGHIQQNILTLAYELTPTRSFGGRVVTQNADTNWYLSFRDAGKKGTEWFVILGDPNSRKFRRMLQVKAVFAF
ncbi:MAG: sugar-binding protein [Fimbriimonadaceae bacterium]